MSKYILKRVLLMIPTLIGAGILVFFLMRLIPGDLCEMRLASTGLAVDQEQIDICRENLGMNLPVPIQFLNFLYGGPASRLPKRSVCASSCPCRSRSWQLSL
jgi:peptide/nickel transport system permease protein